MNDSQTIPTIDTVSREASQAEINTANEYANNNSVQTTPFTDGQAMEAELAKLGETLGDFKAYDSQLPIAEVKGTRIVKCLYQVNKDGKKAQDNSYVRIPCKHLTEEHVVSRITELAPFVLGFLQTEEDLQIKDLHRKGGLNVHTEYLNLDKIIEALEAKQISGRLNKDMIESWFTDKLEDSLAILFADKMGLSDSSSKEEFNKLELVLGAYKAKFASLASPKVFIKEQDCEAMVNVIKQAEGENISLIGSRFITKLESMGKKIEETLFSL